VNADGTKLLFTRPAGAVAPVAPVVEVKETFHVGTVGQREVVFLKEVKVIDRGQGYYGQQWLSILEDEKGNTFFYNGMLNVPTEERQMGLEFKVGIKSHIKTKTGSNVTVISRPALTKEQKQLLILSR
jgi:hypothetical protein